MEAGTLTYAGKYSSPDYEMLLAGGCGLAVESTMILHTPKVQEKLEQIGIPVFIDRSSYERDPLGRTEWIRVYGVLTGKEEEAEAVFASEQKMAEEAETYAPSGKTITCFYLNAEHQVVLRTGEDYIAKMLETAGFSYLAPEGGRGRAASLTMPVEEFYDLASERTTCCTIHRFRETWHPLKNWSGMSLYLRISGR
jgi:iron complex transport system substrate-binding protein